MADQSKQILFVGCSKQSPQPAEIRTVDDYLQFCGAKPHEDPEFGASTFDPFGMGASRVFFLDLNDGEMTERRRGG